MILNIFLFTVFAVIIVFLWVAVFDSNRFVTQKYYVETDKTGSTFHFVFLTDLHNKQYGRKNERLISAIDAEHPDFILLGGDMLSAKKPLWTSFFLASKWEKKQRKKNGATIALLQNLAARYPVYYAMGNHESRSMEDTEKYGTLFEDYRKELAQTEICFLDNQTAELENFPVTVSGLSLEKKYYKKFIERVLPEHEIEDKIGTASAKNYQILLAHNPEFFQDYAKWKPDLVLAGHVHGGVVRLPFLRLGGVISPSLRLFPHYDGGLFEEYGCKMILGRGLGMHTIPIRIFNPGELVSVEVGHNDIPKGK